MRYRSFGMFFAAAMLLYYFAVVGIFPAIARLLSKAWRAAMAEAGK